MSDKPHVDEETRQLASLVSEVRSTRSGKDMLDLLKRRYVDIQLFRTDQRKQDYALGQHDLVNYLIYLEAYHD